MSSAALHHRGDGLTDFEYHVALHGWRRLWARLRGKPWAWKFTATVRVGQGRFTEDGRYAVELSFATPLVEKQAVS